MPPAGTRFQPLEAIAIFALSVTLLLFGGALVFADLGLAGIALGQVGFIAGPALLLAHHQGGGLRAGARLLGLRRTSIRALVGAALVGLSFWFLLQCFVWPIAERYLEGREVVEELEKTMIPSGRPLALSLLVFACLPALCEEVLLRGVVARGLRPVLGLLGSVALSAALFGLLHVVPAHALVTAVFGVPLGLAALLTDSILPSMLMHFLNNATTILLGAGALPTLGRTFEVHTHLAAAVCAAASVAGITLLVLGRVAPGADSSSS